MDSEESNRTDRSHQTECVLSERCPVVYWYHRKSRRGHHRGMNVLVIGSAMGPAFYMGVVQISLPVSLNG